MQDYSDFNFEVLEGAKRVLGTCPKGCRRDEVIAGVKGKFSPYMKPIPGMVEEKRKFLGLRKVFFYTFECPFCGIKRQVKQDGDRFSVVF